MLMSCNFMKEKILKIIDILFIFCLLIFLILIPLFNGIYREIYIDAFIIVLLIINVLGIVRAFLKLENISKIFYIILIFCLTFLIPYIFKSAIYINYTLKSFFITFLLVLLSFNTINIFYKRQDKFIKFVIISSFICSIISIISIYDFNLFRSIEIYNQYGDFYKTSVDRLYGTLMYPNVLALYNIIGIILCFKFIDKKIYKFVLYISLLCLFLTISKSMIILFFIILVFFKKNYKFLISLILPLLLNVGLYRNMYIFNNLILFIIITIILYIFVLIINKIINKNFKKYLIFLSAIIIISLMIGNIPLVIRRTNEEIIIADMMKIEKNTNYTLQIDSDGDKQATIYVKKYFLLNNELNFVIEKAAPISKNVIIKFKTDDDFEFYSIVVKNYSGKSVINSVKLINDGNIKNIPVNYFLFPYNYVTMFSQLKYDISSLEGRSSIYFDCIKLMKKNIFTGKGFNSFKQYSLDNKKAHNSIEEHSYILRIGVENGILSLAVWIIIIISLIVNCLRSYKCDNYLYFSIISILIIISSLYDFTLSYGLFLYLLITFSLFLKKQKNKDILCICSSGGHLTAMKNLETVYSNFNYILITEKNKIYKKSENTEYVFYCSKHYLLHYLLVLPLNAILNFYYFIKYNPRLIITTGSHTGVLMCFIGKFFRKKVIFVEVFDRYKTLTLSGRLVYPIADKFIVQHKELMKKYPKSIYIGGMYL